MAALISGKRIFFSRSLESRPFRELTGKVEVSLPDFGPPFTTGTYPVDARLPDYELVMDPAFRVEKWIGAEHPTILYHHGNNERPFDYRNKAENSFCNIFATSRDGFPANLLNFNRDFDQITTANLHPILARYDRYIEYEVQAKSYGNHPIRTIDFGHITGALQAKVLREHILEVLKTYVMTAPAIQRKTINT